MRQTVFILLAVIGMMPASLLPVLVSVSHGGLGLTITQSATLGAAGIFWAAVGALAIALTGVPRQAKHACAVALALLCVLDLGSMRASNFEMLVTLRGVHGFVGGMLTGVGYAGLARSSAPDRMFAVLLTTQFLVGGAAIAVLPSLIATTGTWLLFASLATVAALTLALVAIMPAEAVQRRHHAGISVYRRLPRGPVLFGMSALFLFEASHTAGGAFMLELGRHLGMGLSVAQSIVGAGAMAGAIGAIGAALLGPRHGRLWPVLGAGVAGLASGVLVLLPSPLAFAAGTVLGSVAWAFSIPFILGACAAFDTARGDAIWLSFVAKLGLAAGPVAGALVVSGDRFAPAIILSLALGTVGAGLFWRLDRADPT